MATSTLPPTVGSDPIPTWSGAEPAGRRTRALSAPGLVILLAGTAALYLWSLSASGYANSFYSAAVQAGSQSWKAFLFGSLDAGNAITVDKPPASLWLMALSVRIFGLSSWSILVPQALLGVATVGILYASVRRSCGHNAGLLAGALLAVTPVAALMFRFANPDALLVFLLTAAAYATLRASERASGTWLVGVGVLVGFAFLTKMLQAFLVLPAFVLVYLIVAPTSLGRRIKHLLLAFAAMIISLGWWVALVELVPETWRPYVGGSETNSVLDLIFGSNGLARILGNGAGLGNNGSGGGFGGEASISRLFETVSGGMITWLIPAALLLATVAMIIRRRAPRTDGVRAAIMLWGGWLLVTGLVFSFMAGIYHEYYTVALTPAIAALVAIGGHVLWQHRMHPLARIGLAATMIITAGWAYLLLAQAPAAYQVLQGPVLIGGVVSAAGLLVAATTGSQDAAGFQLATERPVMAIGGFGGGDPSPTLAQFQAYVAEGQIHYYIGGGNRGGGGGPGGNDGSATKIATWVAANFTATTVDGVTLYDLTSTQ